MSSSKIQEYNLDPNMGLAKESTSQEILEKVTNGVKADFRSPIRTAHGCANNSTVLTGTGKGTLLVGFGSSVIMTVTVDGVTQVSQLKPDNGFVTLNFEFTESFSVVSNSTTYNVQAVAVFY